MTRTAALGLDGEGIFINSGDTGWITNEQRADVAAPMHAAGLAPPLDEIDGAARVVDPMFVGARSGRAPSGRFLKELHADVVVRATRRGVRKLRRRRCRSGMLGASGWRRAVAPLKPTRLDQSQQFWRERRWSQP